jgi:hypothetical protein
VDEVEARQNEMIEAVDEKKAVEDEDMRIKYTSTQSKDVADRRLFY